MSAVAVVVALAILLIIALIHIYWVFGGEIGIEAAIPRREGKPLFSPPKTVTLLVAGAVFWFAYVGYYLYFIDSSFFFTINGGVIAAVFFVRALGDFKTVGFFKKEKGSKFAKYDTFVFVPICLYLGVVFGLLTVQ